MQRFTAIAKTAQEVAQLMDAQGVTRVDVMPIHSATMTEHFLVAFDCASAQALRLHLSEQCQSPALAGTLEPFLEQGLFE